MLHSFDLQGVKDSFSDLISNISPEDTILVSDSNKETTPSTNYKWQIDALDKVIYDLSTTNDILEGAVAEPDKEVISVHGTVSKEGNTQIFRKTFEITDTALASSSHGRQGELQLQLMKAGKELKNSMEVVFSSKQARVKSSDSKAPKTEGLFIQIAAKDLDNPDLPTPDKAGDNAVHKKAVKIEYAILDSIALALYRSGSKANIIVTNPVNSTDLNAAVKAATSEQLEIFDEVKKDASTVRQTRLPSFTDSLGKVWEIKYSRFAPVDLVYFLNTDDLTQRVLREPKASKLGKFGASERWQLVIESGLQLSNPFAAGVLEIGA